MRYYLGNISRWKYVYDIETGKIEKWERNELVDRIEEFIFDVEDIEVNLSGNRHIFTADRLIEVVKKYGKSSSIYTANGSRALVHENKGKYNIYLPETEIKVSYSSYGLLVYKAKDYVYVWHDSLCYSVEFANFGRYACVGVWEGRPTAVHRDAISRVHLVVLMEDNERARRMSKSEFMRMALL